MGFRRILCAVDFSPHSNHAFREAVELAAANRAKLFILHAIEVQPLASSWMRPDALSDLIFQVEERAKESLEKLENSEAAALEGLSVHSEITSGRAYTEIVENARVWDADLIVLGSKGVGSIEDLPLGSTVDRVIQDVNCSVLVVKEE